MIFRFSYYNNITILIRLTLRSLLGSYATLFYNISHIFLMGVC
ncbi:putative membrane protein [Pseudoalteromonas translucida]|uniref:Membrane protein n=1 Tax=Pseudoalteromonas translucida (strain TAC 125) TaxID=326442 RepID=Q3IL23_PSET1|nr:putative membrane protein [Pseudoalteromonas translucida]